MLLLIEDRRASAATAAHEQGCYDRVDYCIDCAKQRQEREASAYDANRFEWAEEGAATSHEHNRSYCSISTQSITTCKPCNTPPQDGSDSDSD